MTPSERDAARRAAYDRKIAKAGTMRIGTPDVTVYSDDSIYLRGEWDVATLSALLQSYLEGK